MIYLKLFLSFLQVGLFSIGGGYAAIPLIQSQVVEQSHWLTMSEFTNLVTIAEMTPGPIAINSATFVGIQIAGIGGAVAATMGCILPSCLIVSLLAWVYRNYQSAPALEDVLGCLRPAVVALIASAGISMLYTALWAGKSIGINTLDWVNLILFAAAFVLLRWRKCNPIAVLCICGVASLILRLAIQMIC